MGQKAEKTKERILQQAYRLFAAKGFQAVTMADICRQTGLSRGGSIADRIQRRESAASILNDLLSALRQEILDQENSLSLALYEYANLGNQELFARLHRQAKERWVGLIQYGMETGQFRQADPDQVSDLILYYYQGLRLWSRVLPLDIQTADRYAQTIESLLLKPEP